MTIVPGADAILQRAKTPREGDRFLKGESTVTVTAVGDGQVWYAVVHGNHPAHNCCEMIEDYCRLADKTIANGAQFEPRESRPDWDSRSLVVDGVSTLRSTATEDGEPVPTTEKTEVRS